MKKRLVYRSRGWLRVRRVTIVNWRVISGCCCIYIYSIYVFPIYGCCSPAWSLYRRAALLSRLLRSGQMWLLVVVLAPSVARKTTRRLLKAQGLSTAESKSKSN